MLYEKPKYLGVKKRGMAFGGMCCIGRFPGCVAGKEQKVSDDVKGEGVDHLWEKIIS